ncbi:B12-binding domain-containing radical SAM protein, partial [candidate division WOR-3 bacterium]|nr:B12-binding domain-containing radical SAM protein [candidate division WOR-3 bacterium]
MSRVLLIFPESDQPIFASSKGAGVLTRPLGFFPPLGILYIGRSLLYAGYKVEAVDFNSTPYNKTTLKRFLSEKDAVGITTNSFNRKNVDILIKDIRKINTDIKIVTGGPDVTLHPRAIEGSDLSIAGEAEKIAPEIFDTLINSGDFSKLYGAIYRNPSSKRTLYGKEPYCESDLDSIKFPARELLRSAEKSQGYNLLGEKNKTRIATMISTRGCPFQCRFCAHNAATFKRYRRRSVENCLDEIEKIYNEGYTILGIVDDNFLSIVNKKLITGILNGISDRGYRLVILVQGRVDSARDPSLYALMRRAGVIGVVYGMESMNQDVLNFYRKGTTVELNRKAADLTYKYGIFSLADFIIG